MRQRALLGVIPIIVGVPIVSALSRALVGPLAIEVAGALAWMAIETHADEPTPDDGCGAEDHHVEPQGPSHRPNPASSVPRRKSGAVRPTTSAMEAAPKEGILVRRQTVLNAVRAGVRPTATPVAATADHPAGLVVHGWGAARAGLVDGDIITMVGGRVPRSVDDVIIAVAGAYKAGHKAVGGTIWRDGRTLAVTVELPFDGPAVSGDDRSKPK